MSSELAIASVSYVLKDLLNDGLINKDISNITEGNVNITNLPPDRAEAIYSGQSYLNLYMYRVSFNEGWKNRDYPSFDTEGNRVSDPPLALDLHYLLTANGYQELHSEVLLGYGMKLFQEMPVLDRKKIRHSLSTAEAGDYNTIPDKFKLLATSGLAEQLEQIKIIPENLNIDELSKLWTAIGSKYRPSAAYQVSVILIESEKSIKTALPVKQRKIYVNPFHQPVIEKIKSQTASDGPIVEAQPILAGYNLVIAGRHLKSEDVWVRIGGKEVEPAKENISDSEILIQLPAGLKAGVQPVYVVHKKMMGSPPEPHRGVESNISSFVLSPQILSISPTSPPSKVFSFNIEPAVVSGQRAIVLLNEIFNAVSTETPLSYSFNLPRPQAASPPNETSSLEVNFEGVEPGDYLVRIRVDGAESPIESDDSGYYNNPQITIDGS